MRVRRARLFSSFVCVVMVCLLASVAAADKLIFNVPDWNQPATYGAPAGYGGWCSPTAGSNIMGYWEDVMGCTGLTDRLIEPLTIAGGYPATAGTWEQGLWIDGSIEMGWWMDTGGWKTAAGPFPPAVWGTPLPNIAPGLVGYASGAWVDNDYPLAGPAPGTGIVKVGYPNVNVTTHPQGTAWAVMWPAYMAEIDADRPVECSFDKWVDTTVTPELDAETFPGTTLEYYPWYPGTDPHSVVGVGYIDPTPLNIIGDEWFVCQDGWNTTGQFVKVPLDSMWLQNDYVHDVPEPFTLMLLTLGGVALIRRRRRG